MISWMLDEYPSVVFSMGHAHNNDIRAMNDLDTVNIVMKFPSNAMAVIDYSRNSKYGYDQRCEVSQNILSVLLVTCFCHSGFLCH